MAWTTSATSGSSMAQRRYTCLLAALLISHLGMFIELVAAAPDADPRAVAEPSLSYVVIGGAGQATLTATLALITSGLLAGLLLIRGRTRSVAAAVPETRPGCDRAPAMARRVDELFDEAHASLMARLNHDLRTPLTAMMGFADLMHTEAFGPLGHDRYRSYAAHMQSCGQELLRATESTLAMAELLANPPQGQTLPIDFRGLVADAWAAATAARRIRPPEFHGLFPDDLRVRGEVDPLRQSLVGLFGVAIARAGAAGRIEFSARCCDGRVQVLLSTSVCPLRIAPATTGCRPVTSMAGMVDDLPLSVSRKLLGLQGIQLIIVTDTATTWTATMSLEQATQSDFFDERPRPAALSASIPAQPDPYGFFGIGASPAGSGSRSA